MENNELNRIFLPHHPKKYKYIMLRWDGDYSIHTEGEIIDVGNHKYAPKHFDSYKHIRMAEDYVDIDLIKEAFKGSKSNVIQIDRKA